MTCFFIGHRYAPEALRPRLDQAVERHIADYGVREFVVGHYGQFDALAAAAVRDAKKRHPSVTLTLLLPYYPCRDSGILKRYDSSLYPEGLESVPKPLAIVRANRYMVEHSAFLICYNLDHPGSTRELVAYARRREKCGLTRVTNLAE